MTEKTAVLELEHPHETVTNRRQAKRYPCHLHVECRPSGSLPASGTWPGKLHDLSQNGVAVQLSRRFEPETRLIIEVKDDYGDDMGLLLAEVVRVVGEPGGSWLMGCSLVRPLSDSDLKAMVSYRWAS